MAEDKELTENEEEKSELTENTENEEKVNANAKWYVLHTYSGYENKVKVGLERLIEGVEFGDGENSSDYFFHLAVPMNEEITIQNGEEKKRLKNALPGYVFVEMVYNDVTWHLVKRIRGVTGFVGVGGNPVPLTEDELSDLHIKKIDRVFDINVGDAVDIVSGPLEGQAGIVESINPELKTMKVKIEMYGRIIPAELDLESVRRVE